MSAPSSTSQELNEGRPLPTKGLVRRFLELIRFSHTVFALPFAALACAFAINSPVGGAVRSSGIVLPESLISGTLVIRLIGVLLCMVTARSAAMAFNRLVDARIDAENPRTSNRHLPNGELSTIQVWLFFVGNCVLFIASCLLFLPNWLPIVLSVPLLMWICGYSLAKRFTSAAHLWLGIALALSPICSWIALRGEFVIVDPSEILPVVVLAVAIALWVSGFDIIYACQDAEFDRGYGLQSLPARLGVRTALRLSAMLHLGMLMVLAALPLGFPQLSLGWLYYLALASVAILVAQQHWLVSPTDLRRVGIAFFNINAVISLGFCLVAAIDNCLR